MEFRISFSNVVGKRLALGYTHSRGAARALSVLVFNSDYGGLLCEYERNRLTEA